MKFNKIFAFALAGLAMTACSDDKTANPGDVLVGFESTEISVLESSIQLNVPIVVTGENVGEIDLTVEIEERGAITNHNFKLTSDRLHIPAGVKSVNLEFLLRDDSQINDDRQFLIKFSSVDNAEVGANSTCLVTLVDNDKNPYNGLQGAWQIVYKEGKYSSTAPGNFTLGADKVQNVVIEGVPEGQLGHGRRLFLTYQTSTAFSAGSGWERQERIRLDYNESIGNLEMEMGQVCCSYTIDPAFTLQLSDGSATPPIDQMIDVVYINTVIEGETEYKKLDKGSCVFDWDDEYQVLSLNYQESGISRDYPYLIAVMMCTNANLSIQEDVMWGNFTLKR